jgi:hypothetical protein
MSVIVRLLHKYGVVLNPKFGAAAGTHTAGGDSKGLIRACLQTRLGAVAACVSSDVGQKSDNDRHLLS